MKYCAFCGSSLEDDMLFCPKCGKKSVACPNKNPTNAETTTGQATSPVNKKKFSVIVAIAAVAIVVTGILLLSRSFSENPGAIERTAESVVLVNCYDRFGELRATGSGFVMYDDSTIVTNYHVIDRLLDIKISTDSDHTFSVESVLAYDVDKDIAILKTTEPTGLKPLPAGNSDNMKKGENVVAIGSPLGKKNTVSAGVFSGRLYNNENGLDELQFSAPISSGSSGGALFNERGQVVGITSASFVDGQNLNLAVPIEVVQAAYSSKGDPTPLTSHFAVVYGSTALSDYTHPENTFVECSELIANPQKYNGKIITTRAYIVPEQNTENRFFVFASADAIHHIPKDNDLHLRWSSPAFRSIDPNYAGYIELCGKVSFTPYDEVISRTGRLLLKKKSHFHIDAQYYYEFG